MATIKSASKAIDELGGTGVVAGLVGLTPAAVSNWRKRGLPRGSREVLGPRLSELGHQFSPTQLFRQYELGGEPRQRRKVNGDSKP